MKYSNFKELRLSFLGFGTMRLPLTPDGSIDRDVTFQMVDYAIEHGINYFDTAYPYHGGLSEVVAGDALRRHPRESWHIANKYPGHQIASEYNPEEIFEDQLRKCGVEWFDFYLMHNVHETCIEVYLDPKWGILDYFLKQKEKGRIRHLGFSAHAELDTLKHFLDSPYGEHMEFCQIQLNFLDWSLQRAREKVELLNSIDIPIWVMEPLRGGKLLSIAKPEEAFRWVAGIPGVNMILSGMSNEEQMIENVEIFNRITPLSKEECDRLYALAEQMKDSVPCTACNYCTPACPMGLDIPTLIQARNDFAIETSFTPIMRIESLPKEGHPSNCIGCGACSQMCPQGIDIPEVISELNSQLAKAPLWREICRQREIAARKMREAK